MRSPAANGSSYGSSGRRPLQGGELLCRAGADSLGGPFLFAASMKTIDFKIRIHYYIGNTAQSAFGISRRRKLRIVSLP